MLRIFSQTLKITLKMYFTYILPALTVLSELEPKLIILNLFSVRVTALRGAGWGLNLDLSPGRQVVKLLG